ENQDEAEDEFWESLPDLDRLCLVRSLVDVVGPDVAEDERPHADEDIDEDLYRGGGGENPARLIADAFRRRLRHDERFGDAAARDRSTIGLDRQPDPCAGHQRLLPQEGLRQERQDQDFNHREYHDQRRYQHWHRRP